MGLSVLLVHTSHFHDNIYSRSPRIPIRRADSTAYPGGVACSPLPSERQ